MEAYQTARELLLKYQNLISDRTKAMEAFNVCVDTVLEYIDNVDYWNEVRWAGNEFNKKQDRKCDCEFADFADICDASCLLREKQRK